MTLKIDDDLLDKASKLTGLKQKTAVIRVGLKALIRIESAKRLDKLGGSEKQLKDIPK